MVRVASGSLHPSVSCVFCSSLSFRWVGSSLLFLQHLCRLRSELILEEQKSGAISNLLRKELGKSRHQLCGTQGTGLFAGLSQCCPHGLYISVALVGWQPAAGTKPLQVVHVGVPGVLEVQVQPQGNVAAVLCCTGQAGVSIAQGSNQPPTRGTGCPRTPQGGTVGS